MQCNYSLNTEQNAEIRVSVHCWAVGRTALIPVEDFADLGSGLRMFCPSGLVTEDVKS